jgi:hypothetical protein
MTRADKQDARLAPPRRGQAASRHEQDLLLLSRPREPERENMMSTSFMRKPGGLSGTAIVPASRGSPRDRGRPAGPGTSAGAATGRGRPS